MGSIKLRKKIMFTVYRIELHICEQTSLFVPKYKIKILYQEMVIFVSTLEGQCAKESFHSSGLNNFEIQDEKAL